MCAARRVKVRCSGSEAGGEQAHLHGGFAHAVKGIATRFRRRTFVHEIAQDRCSCQYSEVHIIKRLLLSKNPSLSRGIRVLTR